MSESEAVNPLLRESPPSPAEPVTAPGSLRALRLARSWSVDDVAVRIKYTARQVDALESGRLEDLPRGLALRGLVRSYARLMSVDSAALEASLAQYIGPVKGGIAQHTSIRALTTAHDVDRRPGSAGWLVLILLVVVAACAVAIWQGLIPAGLVPEWLRSALR
ncbi:MAG: helix-turn-helix domain-containing protein [Burkholderiaceae bacterium]|nr:helix-turn-helix domain-containing protein [Burkholderiaceae bacterium]